MIFSKIYWRNSFEIKLKFHIFLNLQVVVCACTLLISLTSASPSPFLPQLGAFVSGLARKIGLGGKNADHSGQFTPGGFEGRRRVSSYGEGSSSFVASDRSGEFTVGGRDGGGSSRWKPVSNLPSYGGSSSFEASDQSSGISSKCTTVYEKECSTSYEKECKTEYENVCNTVYK